LGELKDAGAVLVRKAPLIVINEVDDGRLSYTCDYQHSGGDEGRSEVTFDHFVFS